MSQQQAAVESVPSHWSVSVWPQLPSELAERIVGYLDRNDIATTIRPINKATAEHFSGPQHTTIRLSEPVSPHAFAAHWLAPGATRGLTTERRRKLVRLVAASGVLPNLEVALQAAGFMRAVAEAFNAAAGAGQLQTCQWLWEYSHSRANDLFAPCRVDDALESAAAGGHRRVCEWLVAIVHNAPLDSVVTTAARSGHADLAEWLLQLLPMFDSQSAFLCGAAHGCDLPILQQAWLRFGPSLAVEPHAKATLLSSAASSPTADWAAKVEWLEAQGCRRSVWAAIEAAALPNDAEALARLTWLHGQGYPIEAEAVVSTALRGNTATLQYLLAEVPAAVADADYRAGSYAAQRGHLAVLQALHAAGWPINFITSAYDAARAGHLHVLVWMLQAQWDDDLVERLLNDENLTFAAAESGSVELLAWLHERGCPWDVSTYEAAESGEPYVEACCRCGDLAMVRCLRRLGVPWGPAGRAFLEAALGADGDIINIPVAPLPLLHWLLEEGCPVDYEDVERRLLVQWGGRKHWRADEVLGLLREHLGRRQPSSSTAIGGM
ncbi:hypothetical protein GPECTOR_77g41 [Gonium pectorale]|uniref:F-box domain-containing protein n=1 Tax=Gonium pectorale TaxID=33097 RepID=A0A150G357_GONPE|nr:hypothetical protein GPECTOR_77g41 [Gonium pectorale]|eukprot:KXZ43945.1 hypothetical protein GPECTOR_77g41 [Gonium pectorale]